CQPCQPGCSTCEDDAPCLIQEDRALRAAVLSCQACCMLAVFLSMLISYHFRRSKARHPRLLRPPHPARIRASGVILLETILFGSLLLYFPVFILYFKPSIFRCIVLRWVRVLGFAIVYGTITLKLYRWQHGGLGARDPPAGPAGVSPLRAPQGAEAVPVPLGPAGALRVERAPRALSPGGPRAVTITGIRVSPAAEMLFLLWGSFLCCAMRAVPSAFHEPRYMGIALHNELMVSAAFHVVRWGWGPWYLMEMGLGSLVFQGDGAGVPGVSWRQGWAPWCFREPSPSSPQFLHAGSPLREEIAAEVYEDELDMRRSGSCLNSSIASAWSEHSLDPDDIREELKKLYTQLEVHKTWGMETNNPHLPKKRSSRRSLGRSAVQR
ncbi:GP179 protein, partial [Centropus unirufus]|nr:GP179 protein [Centropus unirufus]